MINLFEIPVKRLRTMARVWVRFARWTYEAKLLRRRARHKEVAPLSAAPKQVVIAMAMHVGAPCKPIVAVGDQVKVGQKIGEIAGLGAPIHASVSGVVKAVEPRPYVGGGKVMSVVIENDFQDTWGSVLTPHPDYSKLSCEEIVEIVKEAGITGMGGAGFPTADEDQLRRRQGGYPDPERRRV